MRKVQCYNCGRRYDFDEDDFCPRCGAFNPPGKGAGGAVWSDGLNEKDHKGSFVHRELHAENRVRKAVGLSKGSRSAAPAAGPQVKRQKEIGKKKSASPVLWIIIIIIAANILINFANLLFW